MRSALALLVTAGLLSACGTSTQFVRTNASPVAMRARAPQTVDVFTASSPQRPYVEVGIVQARQSSGLSTADMPDIIQALREEAADQGCDGVIITANADDVRGGEYRGTGGTETLQGYRGACIVYTPTASGSSQAAPLPSRRS